MATILSPHGLLAYGDDDPRNPVVFRSPLTSEAKISSPDIGGGTYSKVGTGQLFDSVKGLNTGSAGYYQIANITNNDKLTYGGELSFDVETAMIAAPNANSPQSTGGRTQTANEVFFSLRANPYVNPNTSLYFQVVNKVFHVVIGYGTNVTDRAFYISDAIGKGQFTRIGIAWSANTIYLFINGMKIGEANRLVNLAAPYYTLIFGRYSDAVSAPLTSGYVRNLQIASRPLSFVVPGVLANGMVFGDSYADTIAPNVNIQTAAWDMEKYINMQAELLKLGMKFGDFSVQSYGGRKVIGSGNAALYLKDNIVTALALKPTIVIDQSGANDLTQTGTLDVAAFTAAKKDHIEQFFGVNGNPTTSVLRMVVCSTPWAPQYTNTVTAAERKPDITSIEKIQAGLPAWFNSTYPALSGRLIYQNTFEDFGGFSPDSTLYDTADLLHPGNKGRYKMGKSWAKGVIKALR